LFKSFGDVVTNVPEKIRRGEPVSAVFIGANPRNNLRLEKTYAMVEKLVPGSSANTEVGQELVRKGGLGLSLPIHRSPEEDRLWQPVRNDADWHLVFRWHRTSELLATSEVTVTWETEEWAEPGLYRLRYFGDSKSLTGTITEFEGVSGEFEVVA
jgi:neutral ceramidase